MDSSSMFFTLSFLSVILLSCSVIHGFKLTILHTNDVHARFEQFNKYGSDCSQFDADEGKCFGGVARRFTKIQEIRGSHDNVLLLDAGDQFMGSLLFSVHRGMATAFFMKMLGYDAMCLGNHEFDLKVEPLARFLDNVTFPVVSCNTDVTRETRLQGKFTKSWTTTVDNEKIGLIGFITPETSRISVPGPTISFPDVLGCVEAEVSLLKRQGVNKIIAVGHAGFAADIKVAAINGIDVVVGGHSNTFLYNGDQPLNEKVEGTYPTVIRQPDGGQGLVVQDFKWGKYLGYLNVTFDDSGVVTEYAGNPILLDGSVTEDPDVLQHVDIWKEPVKQQLATVIGQSNVLLSSEGEICQLQDCNIGNLITDAVIDYHVNYSHPGTQWAPAAIALWNGGGIRSSIDKGEVTYGEVRSVLPFNNEIDLLTLKGENIREQLEVSVSDYNLQEPNGRFLQMSGLRVVYNVNKPVGERVVSVEARCLECDVPSYFPLQDNKEYKVFLSGFVINGGDGYNFKPTSREPFNTISHVVLSSYIKKRSPVYSEVDGRIRFVTEQTSDSRVNSATCFCVAVCVLISELIVPPISVL